MAKKPYVEAHPGDVLTADKWNAIQKETRRELHTHRHTSTSVDDEPNDGLRIPRDGIEDGAIDGSKVATDAALSIKSLKISGALEIPTSGATSLGNTTMNNAYVGDCGHGAGWASFCHKSSVSTEGYGVLAHKDGKHVLINVKKMPGASIIFRADNKDLVTVKEDGELKGSNATFSGELKVTGKATLGDTTMNNAFVGDCGHTSAWASFCHKDSVSTTAYGIIAYQTGKWVHINMKETAGAYVSVRASNKDLLKVEENGNVRLTKGKLFGAARNPSGKQLRICTGKSTKNWVQYGNGGVYIDVDTSACGFTRTPNYVTSLHGSSSHWDTTGGSSVYSPTKSGFRVYVRWSNGRAITVADVKSKSWYIQWIAVGE